MDDEELGFGLGGPPGGLPEEAVMGGLCFGPVPFMMTTLLLPFSLADTANLHDRYMHYHDPRISWTVVAPQPLAA